MDLGLRDRRVLVTAGAGGIGRVIAQRFLAEGARIAVCDIDEAALEDCAGDCHIAMGRARSVGGQEFFRLLRRWSAMCPSPQPEVRGAFGLK
jgi:NAD(P)-dependent dehydrogenase (short-subunit alcohol dehydrogenase family)